MKNNLLSAGILGFGLLASSLIIANGAFAQIAEDSIQFPVAELGNCKDKDTCKTYCDDTDHVDACLAFAEKNNLMSRDEITTAKKFMEAGGKGPGGCTGKESCQNYCDDVTHIDECVAFAEKTGMLPPKELAEAKQVQAAIAKGVKPPACNGKKECDAYCEDSGHMKECIAFGEAAGFLQGKDLEDAKKVLTAVENGATPPACKGKEACDAYCSESDHMEACMTFAQVAGLMTPEEAQNSQKMLVALKKGVKPPACRGKEECDVYCTEPAHTDECISFAIAAGFMTDKEAEMAKKTGGKGPGGCTSKDACEAFCGNSDNQQTCMDFAKENGFDMESGEQGGGKNFSGPGGCKTKEACTAYCEDNKEDEACKKMMQDFSGPGEYIGPGGCKGKVECEAFCGLEANRDTCANFAKEHGMTDRSGSDSGGAGECAQQGGDWIESRCDFGRREAEKQCVAAGGNWNGSSCNNPNECAQQGGNWTGSYCDFGARECATQGGAWDGSTCNFAPSMPTGPQSFNFDLNSSLAAVITSFRVPF